MTKNLISKELLSSVYDFDVQDSRLLGTDNVTYEIRFNGIRKGYRYKIINIHELAHKCKEWALVNKYEVLTFLRESHIYKQTSDFLEDKEDGIIKSFIAKDEPEAIFKACEYILKEMKK